MHKTVARQVIFELRKVLEDAAMNIQDKLDSDELCDVVSEKEISNIKIIENRLNATADRLYALEINPIHKNRQTGF